MKSPLSIWSAPEAREGRPRSFAWIVLVGSALPTLVFWAVAPHRLLINEGSDYSRVYEPVARQIAAGNGVVTPGGRPALRTPPGFPAFLAIGFSVSGITGIPEATMMAFLRIICMAGSSVFLFLIARKIWGPRPALLTAIAWATYPLAVWLTKQPNSEGIFLVFCYGGILSLWRGFMEPRGSFASLLLAGVLIGLSMLIRPFAIGFGLAAACAVVLNAFLRRRQIASAFLGATLILLGNVVVVLPWEAWVYARTGQVILLNATSLGPMRDGLTFAPTTKGLPKRVADLADDLRPRFNREVRTIADVGRLLLSEMRVRPGAVLELLAIKVARTWYGTDSRRFETWILIVQIPYLALVGWSFLRAWRARGDARSLALLVVILVSYGWVMTVLALSIARYIIPSMGLMFTLLPALMLRERRIDAGVPEPELHA